MRPRSGIAPHVNLLLTCSGDASGASVSIAASTDWSRFCALVEHHGMGPHVDDVLAHSDEIPTDVRRRLRELHADASSYSLLLAARLVQLVIAFEQAGIPVVSLKGPALSQQLYGDPGRRDSLDIDLLVPVARIEDAVAVLRANGYQLESELDWMGVRQLAARRSDLTFRSESGTGVDLHWAVSPADYPSTIPESRLWSSLTSVPIAGRQVPVLSSECLLVYLCIHGTRHCWTKLRWLSDVSMLLARNPEIDWKTVDAIASESRASRALALGLALAHDLLGATLPRHVLERIDDDVALRSFTRELAERLRSPDPAPQPTAVARTLFNARLAPSRWLGVRHAAALLKAPTDADAEFVRLPRALILLYYPFRAVRLVFKYGRVLVAGH